MKRGVCKETKGFTLIELILALALVGIVMMTSFSTLLFGNRVFGKTNRQYTVQSDVRRATDYIHKEVRFATDIIVLETAPSALSDDDAYDYLYMDGTGSLIHSSYDGGNTRVEKTILSNLKADSSYFISEEQGASIGIRLESIEEGPSGGRQEFEVTSEIALPNLVLNERFISVGYAEAAGIKFKADTTLSGSAGGDTEEETEEDPPPSETSVSVTVVIKTTSNNSMQFRVVMDGAYSIVPIKTAAKTYTAPFGSFLSGTMHTLTAEKYNSSTGAYEIIYGPQTFVIPNEDIVKEIPG